MHKVHLSTENVKTYYDYYVLIRKIRNNRPSLARSAVNSVNAFFDNHGCAKNESIGEKIKKPCQAVAARRRAKGCDPIYPLCLAFHGAAGRFKAFWQLVEG